IHLVVTDANERFVPPSIAGATLSNGNHTLSIPLASITGTSITLDGAAGSDAVTFNATDLATLNLTLLIETSSVAAALS
ncbi:hypothetical protein ACH0C8_16630, partial [Acetobacter lovaniensis]|uniref:hypothetical protein n=1 Tax=Acetobacter lovaniensis TaxID=104100 RepID=UPI00376F76C2